ncbi:MAG: FecR domain-containing protein [Paludibacteraceae bacterium]|nr:FecR domain-containing protein [Paludibacteraceae bacterium]
MKQLFEKYLAGNATAEERESLLRQLHADEQLGGWLRADIEFAEGGMPEPIRERILNNIYARTQRPLISRRCWSIAAVMLILIISGALGWTLFGLRNQNLKSQISNNQIRDIIVTTGMGEHSRVSLPDGSLLTLNAQTTVRYNLADGKRQVSIDGEAFFEVARDPEHPFVVSANGMTVTCLGTSFDVRNYSDESTASVVLRDGKVRVNARDADLTMEPGSRVLMDRQTLALSKHTVTPSDYTAWLNGEIKFNNQTLEEIAAELSRNYNIDLVITSDELRRERFNGYLGRSSLRNILDVLCLASDMSYHVDNDTMVYIYPRKKR